MVWLPDGKKMKILCLFVSTESTNVTDKQTPHDGKAALTHSIALQKLEFLCYPMVKIACFFVVSTSVARRPNNR